METLEVREDVAVEDLSEAEREALVEVARRLVDEGEALQEALGVSEEYVESMECFAHRLYANGKFEKAGVLIEGVLALDETRYYPYLLVGDIAMQEERWEDAVTCLEAASEFGPESARVEGKLGEALLRAGRLEAAVARLQTAVAVADDPEQKYRRRSQVLLELIKQGVEQFETPSDPA